MLYKSLSLLIIFSFLNGIFKRVTFSPETSQLSSTPKYNSVIYIVLDALRYDYILNNLHTPSHYLHNTMLKYYSLPHKFEALSVCGIPTSTTCRITGLLTGTPSNFLEGSKTFLRSEIYIDNLVNQMYKKYDGKISFFGDSTWLSLCPVLSKCPHFAFDPYSKTDLIKNENLSIDNLLDRIGVDKAILCHLISLDSFGHIHKSNMHSDLKNSLLRFDDMIDKIYKKMDTDTLLVLTSDHGVTDQGEHGGTSSHEMSSFVSIISKKPIPIYKVSEKKNFIRKNFISKKYDLTNKSYSNRVDTQKCNIVHQDDILPTICYLLGICVPYNTYGNLIPELVNDNSFENMFYNQKCKMLNKKQEVFLESDGVFKAHYVLSQDIYNEFSGMNTTYLIISFVLYLILAMYLLVNTFSYCKTYLTRQKLLIFDILRCLVLVFSIIMVSHSVGAIKNEILIWILVFLICNKSPKNIPFIFLYFLHNKTGAIFDIFFYLCLIFICLQYKNKNFSFFIILSLLKDFFPSFFSSNSRELISLYPSFSVMSLLIYNPKFNICLLCLPYLSLDVFTTFSVLNLIGGDKSIKSIDFSVAYTFTDSPSVIDSLIPGIFYFTYSRSLIKKSGVIKYLNLFSLLCVFAVTWWEFDSMSFYFHFADRCFFACLFYILDLILK
ncbi:GPI ethanolamine phosphate transferase [Vairimorpha necatrix]|uniref:GPI ethanolamine phosphate transferase n=1 Tax=Vairimorpha necatrix TaxID=6039 RepID=A0AAX4JGQ0_9MICR